MHFLRVNVHYLSLDGMINFEAHDLSRPWVNVTFYDTDSVIYDVITTAHPFPYTAKFIFVGVTNNKTQ